MAGISVGWPQCPPRSRFTSHWPRTIHDSPSLKIHSSVQMTRMSGIASRLALHCLSTSVRTQSGPTPPNSTAIDDAGQAAWGRGGLFSPLDRSLTKKFCAMPLRHSGSSPSNILLTGVHSTPRVEFSPAPLLTLGPRAFWLDRRLDVATSSVIGVTHSVSPLSLAGVEIVIAVPGMLARVVIGSGDGRRSVPPARLPAGPARLGVPGGRTWAPAGVSAAVRAARRAASAVPAAIALRVTGGGTREASTCCPFPCLRGACGRCRLGISTAARSDSRMTVEEILKATKESRRLNSLARMPTPTKQRTGASRPSPTGTVVIDIRS
jgi:hypothetical protein